MAMFDIPIQIGESEEEKARRFGAMANFFTNLATSETGEGGFEVGEKQFGTKRMLEFYKYLFGGEPPQKTTLPPSTPEDVLGGSRVETKRVWPFTPTMTAKERQTVQKSKAGLQMAPAAEEKLGLQQEFTQKLLGQRQEFQESMFGERMKHVEDMYNRRIIDLETRERWREQLTLQRDSEREAGRKELENLRQQHRLELDKLKGERREHIPGAYTQQQWGEQTDSAIVEAFLPLARDDYEARLRKQGISEDQIKSFANTSAMLQAISTRDPLGGIKYNVEGLSKFLSSQNMSKMKELRVKARGAYKGTEVQDPVSTVYSMIPESKSIIPEGESFINWFRKMRGEEGTQKFTPTEGTITFRVGGKTFKIPQSKVLQFRRENPEAIEVK